MGMEQPDWQGPLTEAYEQATRFLTGLPDRPVGSRATLEELRASLGGPLPRRAPTRGGHRPAGRGSRPGVVASPSGRFFGFVIGGAMPAALAADWLTATWDQNAGLYAAGPAAAVVEEVAGELARELFGLPAARVGRVRHRRADGQLHRRSPRRGTRCCAGPAGTSRRGGLHGAPRIAVLAGADRHSTIDRALRFLGIGTAALVPVAVDAQGRHARRRARARPSTAWTGRRSSAPRLGNVNTGAFDPIGEICDAAHAARGLGARRRRVRAVGRREPAPAAPRRRRRARRLVGDRRAQVAQRPVRLRARLLRRTRRRTARRWASGPRTSSTPAATSATRSTSTPSSPAAPGASRCTRRCARSAATASRR